MAAAAVTALAATAVIAQNRPNPGAPAVSKDMGATKPAGPASATAGKSAASDEFMKSMDRMHDQMPKSMTGDPDRDFVQMMIPHHQGAIDMARVELKYGKDARTKALARKIIKDQQREITEMKSMLAKRK